MRSTIPLAHLLSACAAPSRYAAQAAYAARRAASSRVPQALANLAGIWHGRLLGDGAGGGTPFSLLQGDADDAGVVAQVAFAGAATAPVQLLEASATTYVALVGPYRDARSGREVVTVLEGRRVGDRLHGTYRAQPLSGGPATVGRFVAHRSCLAAA